MMRNRDMKQLQQILLMRRLVVYLLVLRYAQALKDSYTYNAGNQLTTDRKHQYEYDSNGNLVKKTEIGDDNKQKIWTYSYDYESRLIKVVKQEDDEIVTVSFKYDPFGRRIEKKVEETEDGKIEETKTYNYVYDNEDIILEYLTKTEDDDEGKQGQRDTFMD